MTARLVLRAGAFNLAFALWTVLVGVVCLPLLAGPQGPVRAVGRLWARGMVVLLRLLVGLRHEVRGPLPEGPVLLAIKHQSAWETLAVNLLARDVAFVLKRELYRFPLVGWYLARGGMIAVDRGGGMRALKDMVERARAVLAEGRPVAIFPEGTRTPPGTVTPYHVGVAALYEQLAVPVVPVALNSGWFWGRRAFLKRPGTITVSFLAPIPPGLPRKAFLARLRQMIEDEVARLDPTHR